MSQKWNILVGEVSQTVVEADSEKQAIEVFNKKTRIQWAQKIEAIPIPKGDVTDRRCSFPRGAHSVMPKVVY